MLTKIQKAKKINNTTNLTIIYPTDSYKELEMLSQRFLNMSDNLQKASDKASIKIFGKDNVYRLNQYMEKYVNEGYLQKLKTYYMKDMIDNNLNIIHLSQSPNPLVMNPRVPNNKLTTNGTENNTIPRICFSTSIFGAISAIESGKEGDFRYVHTPINPQKIINNDVVAKYVPDAKNTNEIWIQDETIFTNVVGKIIIGKPFGICEKYYINKDKQYSFYYDYIFYPYEPDFSKRLIDIISFIN